MNYLSFLFVILLTSNGSLFQTNLYAKANRDANSAAPTSQHMADFFSENRQGVSIENLRRAEELRLQTISSIEKLLKGNMPEIRKFELYLRLGELHSERHDYIRDIEYQGFEKAFSVWEKGGRKGSQPELSYRQSEAALLKSANSFRRLVREFPKHPRTDAALYALAKTLLRLNNDNAILYFNQLLKTHKNSVLIPDTHLALGEFYFYRHNMPKAMEHYRAAMSFKDSKVYPYAIYKLGWAYFNSTPKNAKESKENIDKSIAAFQLVIKLSEVGGSQENNLDLRKEAIKDLIMVFAEYERTEEALAYFNRIDEKKAFYDMLQRLGSLYSENGLNEKAIIVFSRLVKEAPEREDTPYIYNEIASLYDKTGNLERVSETFKSMLALFNESSSWYRASRQDMKKVQAASENSRKNLHRFATKYHDQGYKLKQDRFLVAAGSLYKLYLDVFERSAEAYELRYYLADIHFYFKRFDAAAAEYYSVSRMEVEEPKFKKDAALNAVVAIRQLDEKQKYPALPPLGQVPAPIEIPQVKKKLIQVMDNHVSLLPEDKDSFPMAYSSAQIYFEYGHYDEAITRYNKLGSNSPATVQGKTAIRMILGFYSERKQWKQLVDQSRIYLKNPAVQEAGLKDEIVAMVKRGMFQYAADLSKQEKFEKAADVFVAYHREFPDSKDADDALFNASTNFYRVAKVDQALQVGRQLLEQFPKSRHTPTVTIDMAQAYESLADFERAAELYEKFGKDHTSDRKARLALFNASTLQKGLNNYDKASDLYRLFVRSYPKDELTKDARFELAKLYEKKGDIKSAINEYTKYRSLVKSDAERQLFSTAKIVELNYRRGYAKTAGREFSQLKKALAGENAPAAYEARRIAARIMFEEASSEFNSFMAMSFLDADTLEREVAKKQSKLLGAVDKYEKVIDLGSGEFTVASLFRLGEMHENFAESLFQAPSPRGASQIEIDQYRSSLEQVAFPLKEEARKYFEAAYNRSKEVQTFTEWTKITRSKMVELDPDNFPLVSEKSAGASYLSHRLNWTQSTAQLTE